jgi:putative membrane protein
VPEPPDLRILQANERTVLAWIRTGLTLMAFGFVVARMGVWASGGAASPRHLAWAMLAGVAFVALGSLANAVAALRFLRVRRAILEGRVIVPGSRAVIALTGGVVLLGGLLVVYLLVG